MPATEIPLIEQSTQKTYAWINDLAQALGRPEDPHYAFRVLRAFLHTLRDRMPVEEAAYAGEAAARVMRRRLAVGEMDKIALIMPGDVAGYLTTERSRRAPA